MYTKFGKHCCTWDTFITFSCRSQLCTFSHTCLKFHHLPQCPLEIQGTVTAPSSGSLGTRLFCVLGSHSTLLFNDSYTSLKFIYLFIYLVSSNYSRKKGFWKCLFNPLILSITPSVEWLHEQHEWLMNWHLLSLTIYEDISLLVDKDPLKGCAWVSSSL